MLRLFPIFLLLIGPAAAEDRPEAEVAATVAFTEGPTVDADGNVYFTETASHRIMKFTPGAGVWRPSSRTPTSPMG